MGYGTILNKRQGGNAYGSLNYRVNDNLQLFTDFQVGYSKVELFSDVQGWNYQDANGSEDGIFYNQFSGGLDYWSRQFTPEEMGGLSRGMIRNTQKTLSITPGIKGAFAGDWNYELAFNHSEYRARGQLAAGHRVQGKRPVPGPAARRQSGQRLRHLQRRPDPALHAADPG